jgi:hypothetical protein
VVAVRKFGQKEARHDPKEVVLQRTIGRPVPTQRGRVLAIQYRIDIGPMNDGGLGSGSYGRKRQHPSAAVGPQRRQRKPQRRERMVLACIGSPSFFLVAGSPGLSLMAYCTVVRSPLSNRCRNCRCVSVRYEARSAGFVLLSGPCRRRTLSAINLPNRRADSIHDLLWQVARAMPELKAPALQRQGAPRRRSRVSTESLRVGGKGPTLAGGLRDITCYGAMAGSMCVEWCRYVQEV